VKWCLLIGRCDNIAVQNNVLVIMSDEHNPKVLGCAGHPIIHTRTWMRSRRAGRCSRAYTTSPVCIPARAGFACGKYIHQIGFWDNATPTTARFRPGTTSCASAGTGGLGRKAALPHRRRGHGFSEELIPMHIYEGKGDLLGLIRDDMPPRGNSKKMAAMAGPGESSYTSTTRRSARRRRSGCAKEGVKRAAKPGCCSCRS